MGNNIIDCIEEATEIVKEEFKDDPLFKEEDFEAQGRMIQVIAPKHVWDMLEKLSENIGEPLESIVSKLVTIGIGVEFAGGSQAIEALVEALQDNK